MARRCMEWLLVGSEGRGTAPRMVAKPARRRQRAAATLPSRTGIAQGASSTAAVDSVTGGARKGAAPRSPRISAVQTSATSPMPTR